MAALQSLTAGVNYSHTSISCMGRFSTDRCPLAGYQEEPFRAFLCLIRGWCCGVYYKGTYGRGIKKGPSRAFYALMQLCADVHNPMKLTSSFRRKLITFFAGENRIIHPLFIFQ
jgi:hypothetical protein